MKFISTMIVLIILAILCNQSIATPTCSIPCPSDKPYCNEAVGCIFECPETFYVNGSYCVSDCGEMFVDENRQCIGSCPENTFYKETLKQVMPIPYLERKCLRCDKYDQFVSNTSCVQVCPTGARYIDQNRCANECPENRPFKINTTIFGLLHHKCTGKCLYFENDGFCRGTCPQNKVAFNFSCYEQCPNSHPFNYSNTCKSKCPNNSAVAGHDSKTCVHQKCPEERPFVFNNTCVDSCPVGFPLKFSTYNGLSGFQYCVNTCGNKYRFDDNCVYRCPAFTVAVNNTCLEKCPKDTPYSCMITEGFQCGETSEQHVDHAICVDVCPQSMLSWNQTCVYACPSGVPLFGSECTDKCPIDNQYTRNITNPINCRYGWCQKVESVLTCIKMCPSESYVSNFSCLPYCPSPLYQIGRECVLKCPESEPLVQNSNITIKVWSYHRNQYYYRKYSKTETNVLVQKCVSACDKEMMLFNLTCVTPCPDDYPIIRNGTCSQQKCDTKYTEAISRGIICVDECQPFQFILNKTCVDTCPKTYLHFNGTCVNQCPGSHTHVGTSVLIETSANFGYYFLGSIILNDCMDKCNGTFEFNGTCVSFCRPPLFTLENKCVASCPSDAPYPETSSITVTDWEWASDGIHLWKKESVKNIIKCKENCPENKVLLGSKCVDMCPLRARYVINGSCQSDTCRTKYKFYTLPGIKCFDECPHELFIHNNTCVVQCPEYTLSRNCITRCPSTHGIIDTKTIGKDLFNCTKALCAKNLINVKECRTNCPGNKFLFKNRCYDICLNNSFTYKNTCVMFCPQSHPYNELTTTSILKWKLGTSNNWYLQSENQNANKCVSQCSNNNPKQFNYSCINKCPDKTPYLAKHKCVEECPENKLTNLRTKQCVDKCAHETALFNVSCYYNCPENVKYIFDSRCVSQCPSSYPVALKEDRFICRKSCEGSKLFKDGECVYSFKCKDPMFAYGALCLHRCPEGFVWFDHCKNTLAAKIAIAVLVVLLVLLFALSRHFLLDFAKVLRLTVVSKEMITEMEKQLERTCSKSKPKTNKMDDEIPLQEFFLHTET